MVNILFLTENFKDTVRQDALYYLEQEVGKSANCRWAGIGWPRFKLNEPMDETVKRVMSDADWVIYFDFGVKFRNTPVHMLPKSERSYKVATYIVDLHRNPSKTLHQLNNSELDALLMTTTRLGKQMVSSRISPIPPDYYINNLKIPFLHMPPCINPEIYKPSNGEKQFDVTFLAHLAPPHYPLRYRMWNELRPLAEEERWNLLIRITPPGMALDKKISRLSKQGHLVGRKYAEALASSKIFLFGTSIYRYPLMKFYEGMACGACVMADVPLSAEELHLVPGGNFVAVDVPDWGHPSTDEDDWREKLRYYLKHDDEREKIAQSGYEMVMKYHTVEVRAKQLLKFLEERS